MQFPSPIVRLMFIATARWKNTNEVSTKTSLNDSSAVCSATTYRSSSYLTMYMARERGRGRRLVIIGLTIGCESPSSQIDLTPREDGLQEEAQPSLSMPVARQRRYGRKYLGEKPARNLIFLQYGRQPLPDSIFKPSKEKNTAFYLQILWLKATRK